MTVTADHGAVPSPSVSGAFQISSGALATQIRERFDDADAIPLLQGVYQTGIFVNTDELRQNGYSLDDVARFIMTLTEGQTAGTGVVVPPDEQNDPVFQAAYPSDIMRTLPCLPEART